MDAAKVSSIMSLSPERVVRVQSGLPFLAEASGCRYPGRAVLLAGFLQWLSPLNPITRVDQRLLGLVAANGRPVQSSDLEDEADADTGEHATL